MSAAGDRAAQVVMQAAGMTAEDCRLSAVHPLCPKIHGIGVHTHMCMYQG